MAETSIPTFEVIGLLGAGGMGEVHLASMELSGQRDLVALKRIHPAQRKDRELLAQFEREVTIYFFGTPTSSASGPPELTPKAPSWRLSMSTGGQRGRC